MHYWLTMRHILFTSYSIHLIFFDVEKFEQDCCFIAFQFFSEGNEDIGNLWERYFARPFLVKDLWVEHIVNQRTLATSEGNLVRPFFVKDLQVNQQVPRGSTMSPQV